MVNLPKIQAGSSPFAQNLLMTSQFKKKANQLGWCLKLAESVEGGRCTFPLSRFQDLGSSTLRISLLGMHQFLQGELEYHLIETFPEQLSQSKTVSLFSPCLALFIFLS